MNRSYIGHLTITAPTLDIGSAYLNEALGVCPQEGGKHPKMGTHNLLLRIGHAVYLEVIAKDPSAPTPSRPRWFALDKVESTSKPVLATWVARTQDIYSSIESCSESIGSVEPMARGNLDWLITIPNNGGLIMKGVIPALIQWQTDKHPTEGLSENGMTLIGLELHHPDTERVHAMLESINFEGPVSAKRTEPLVQPYLKAIIETPNGVKYLVAPNKTIHRTR